MTIARLLPLHIHGALEAALALLIMAAPFVLGFEPAAMVALLTIGALVLSVALMTHIGDEDALPISTHLAFDIAFAIVMAAGALAFAAVGQAAAAGLLAAGSVSLVLICSLTRYSPNHA
jgi:hypothetical protein